MAKFPKVYFYTPKGKFVSLNGIGNPGNHVYKFSYKYSETDGDVGDIILVFTHTHIDLTYLQPGIGYKIRWGYVNGAWSDERYIAIKEVSYKYSTAGFTVSLKIVAKAAYQGEATLRDSNGDSLEETIEDAAKVVEEYSLVYTTNDGHKIKYIKLTDGSFEYKGYTPDGRELVPKLDQKTLNKIHGEFDVESLNTLWERNYYRQFGRFYGGSGAYAVTPPFSADTRRVGLLVSQQNVMKALSVMYKNAGFNMIQKVRDDKVINKEIDWGAEAEFGISSNSPGIISWTIDKSDKEANILSTTTTTIDPTTKEIKTHVVEVGKPFDFYVLSPDGKELTEVTYYKKGDSYYMNPHDADSPTKIEAALFKAQEKQAFIFGSLVKKGWSPKQLKEDILKGRDPVKTQEYQEALKDKEIKDRITRWGFRSEDLKAGRAKLHYSGRSFDQIRSKNIQDEMDKIFYNSKLTIRLEGNPTAEDAVNFYFYSGNKDIDGLYHIDGSEHAISSAGYITTIVAYRVVDTFEQIKTKIITKTNEGLPILEPEIVVEKNILDNLNHMNNGLGYLKVLVVNQEGLELYEDPSGATTSAYRFTETLRSGTLFSGAPFISLKQRGDWVYAQKYNEAIAAEEEVVTKEDAGLSADTNQTVEEHAEGYNLPVTDE